MNEEALAHWGEGRGGGRLSRQKKEKEGKNKVTEENFYKSFKIKTICEN